MGPSELTQHWSFERALFALPQRFSDCTPCLLMTIVNMRQASALLGFRTTTTLRRLLQEGELDAYRRSGPDLRATYLETAPKGLPTLLRHVQSRTQCRDNSPLWGSCSANRPRANRKWTDVANDYLDMPQWWPPPRSELQWVTLRNVNELADDSC